MAHPFLYPVLDHICASLKVNGPGTELRETIRRMEGAGALPDAISEAACAVHVAFVRQEFLQDEFETVLRNLEFPLVVFIQREQMLPVVIEGDGKTRSGRIYYPDRSEAIDETAIRKLIPEFLSSPELYASGERPQPAYLLCLCPVPTDAFGNAENRNFFSPLKRFLRFVFSERRQITTIYLYALIIGVLNLSLPLGIQAIINRISGGILFDGVVILIVFVLLGILISGGLQIMQMYLVEMMQRRLFTRAAFEFAFRVPRIRSEALMKLHPPELMNRFFDVITLQKGFSKILLDLTTAFLQIFFGLLLLSFYHSSFVVFGLLLFGLLGLMFRWIGPGALKTSIKESSQKYRMVAWFEEMARNIHTFRQAGASQLPLDRTDVQLEAYLKARKKHFGELLKHFVTIHAFRLLVTAGTLILGCVLVVDRQITLGQFVASEIVIITVIGAVEKLILQVETVYDVLTAVEKIAQVTDLPLQREQGIRLPQPVSKGLRLEVQDLTYQYPGTPHPILKNVRFNVASGERVCITGPNGSGKKTLMHLLAGLYSEYQGQIKMEGIPLRNLHPSDLFHHISVQLHADELFPGTIEENIRMGRTDIPFSEVLRALDEVGLSTFIHELPEGIFTELLPGGKGLHGTVIRKILLARSLIRCSGLYILRDLLEHLSRTEKIKLIDHMLDFAPQASFVVVSADPEWMKRCHRVVIIDKGSIVAEGSYESLLQNPETRTYLNPA